MSRFRSVRIRLAISHLAVVAVGAVSVVLVARVAAPTSFETHMADMGMPGMSGVMNGGLRDSFDAAVDQALFVSVTISVAVAVAASVIAARRMAAPIDRVRTASRRLAEGHYSERVDEPLELELAALARDVNHLAATLEHTEERRARLLGEVSHELRHPIATLQGYLEAMLDGVLAPSPEVLMSMANEAARLNRLATDLNLVSRAEEGVLPLERRPTELGALLESTVRRLEPQFVDEGVMISLRPGPPVLVDVDPDRVAQILTNIVGNALTYTPKGGSVTVSWTAGPGAAGVTVTDTGLGLSREDLERVFERFYRADRSAPGGTGVGLTIARSLARLHGGDVTAVSPGEGAGSTFTIILPTASDGHAEGGPT
ncbi:MAG TPA: HAMP domain-containing sensor histidine kinase [Acidimicrobiia bacterium]